MPAYIKPPSKWFVTDFGRDEPPKISKFKIGGDTKPPFLERAARAADSHLRTSSETPISFTPMVHHAVLYKLKPEVTPARIETMMMNTRMQLLKIPEVLSIKCGKRIDPENEWPFFIAIDFESMDKYAIFREDPIYVKFVEEVIKPNTEDSLALDFEMDPGKDVRFS